MNFLITPVLDIDITQLHECMKQVFAETDFMLLSAGETNNLMQYLNRRINFIATSNRDQLWGVKNNNHIIGWLDAQGTPARKKQHSICVVLGLLKEYWHQGLGSQLLQTLLKWADDNAIKRIELTVVETNERAIGLYKKYGFEIEGVKQKSLLINGKYYNELMMAKLLQ